MDVLSLPNELLIRILEYVEVNKHLVNVFLVCMEFGNLSRREDFWECMCKAHLLDLKSKDKNQTYLEYYQYHHRQDGDLYTWGRRSDDRSQKFPTILHSFLTRDVMDVFCGENCCSIIVDNGKVFIWGHNEKFRLGVNSTQTSQDKLILKPTLLNVGDNRIKQICHSPNITLFLTCGGSIWACGDNSNGFISETTDNDEIPQVIKVPQIVISSNEDREIIKIASSCGSDNFAFIDEEGRLFTWGKNEFGQLGHGPKGMITKPTLVQFFTENDLRVSDVSFGLSHTLFLTSDGRLFASGDNTFGQLGVKDSPLLKDGFTTLPISVEFFSGRKVVHVSCGNVHSAVIDEEGSCYVWGNGDQGQMGNGTSKKVNFVPSQVSLYNRSDQIGRVKLYPKVDRFTQISCGSHHIIGLVQCRFPEGKHMVLSWGSGGYGKLGIGEEERNWSIPQEVERLGSGRREVRKIHAGGEMSACTVKKVMWVEAEGDHVEYCMMDCGTKFTIIRRRHHCRHCGGLFCRQCSAKRIPIKKFGIMSKVRVCDRCFEIVYNEDIKEK